MPSFSYKYAIFREPSKLLPAQALRANQNLTSNDINFQKIQKNWQDYVDKISANVEKAIIIKNENEKEDIYPDSIFIEDTAISANGKVMLTNPGHESRRGEVIKMKEVLDENRISYSSCSDFYDQSGATKCKASPKIDGGDVLFLGPKYGFLVGISKRTNESGAECIKKAFPEFSDKIFKIPVGDNTLHLKCACSLGNEKTIILSKSEFGSFLEKEILKIPILKNNFKIVHVDSNLAANVVWLKNIQVGQNNKKSCKNVLYHQGQESFQGQKGLENFKFQMSQSGTDEFIQVDMDELDKVDGSLTCCCLLIE